MIKKKKKKIENEKKNRMFRVNRIYRAIRKFYFVQEYIDCKGESVKFVGKIDGDKRRG